MNRIDQNLPIGGTFELDGNIYMVMKDKNGTNEATQSCTGCAFKNTLTCGRFVHRPACSISIRKDKTSVIFKEVTTSIGPTVQTQLFEEPAPSTFLPVGSIFTRNNNKYIVVPGGTCRGCAFKNDSKGCAGSPRCLSSVRKDETGVIFELLPEVTSVSNELIYDGKKYIAKSVDSSVPACEGCGGSKVDANGNKECKFARNGIRPHCTPVNRKDGQRVIFVEEDYVLDENEFTYDNKKYVAMGSTRSVERCELCAFNTIINGKNICCTSLDQGKRPSCRGKERMDTRYVYFIEKGTIANNNNQKINNMKNYIEKIKSLILPSTNNDFVFTMDGKLGLRKDDKIISYDKTTNEFTEYPSDFGIEIPVFEISALSNQIKEGDVIKHNNSWCIVKSIKDNNISVLSYTGTSKKVQVVNNFLLGQKVVRKIMSFDIQGSNNNNMNPMMMLALMDGKDGNDTVKTMLMMQMMQSNNKGFNPMMMLMLDKSIDMKDLLMMNMMGGMQMPFFGNSSDSPASK